MTLKDRDAKAFYRKIIATRNFIIHEYDFVDDAQVWQIIDKHLPLLKQEVEELL